MKLESQNKITYEGPIACVTLTDSTRLYGPATLPDRIFARKRDQIVICAVNERSTEDILMFEHMNGILETDDSLAVRPHSNDGAL